MIKRKKHTVSEVAKPNPIVSIQKTEHMEIIMIPIQEYDRVLQENRRLHEQIAILTGRNEQLEKFIKDKEKTIEELTKENDALKQRIKQLEETVAGQSLQIAQLTKNVGLLLTRKVRHRY